MPFQIKPVLRELLQREINVFVVRDRDGLSNDIIETMVNVADEKNIIYHVLHNYEIESYLLQPDLLYRTTEALNPEKELPTIDEIERKIIELLRDTIRLSKYKYNTVLEDCLSKLSSFDNLEIYRSANEYRNKADMIRSENELYTDIDNLRRVGMGKECLKGLMSWLNDEKHLHIAKRSIIENLIPDNIPQEIVELFRSIMQAIKYPTGV